MTTVLEHASEDRQQRFGEKLDALRKQSVTPETYERFNDAVQTIIDQVDEIILALQDEREELKTQKAEFKQRYGEQQLQLLREEDADHIQLGETGYEGDLRRLNRRLEDWGDYRAEVQRIGRLKLREVLDQIDAQSVKTQTLEKLDEITKKRVEDADAKIERVETDLKQELTAFKQEMKTERRSYRKALREERDRDWQLIRDVLQPAIKVLQQFGTDVEALRDVLADRVNTELPVESDELDGETDAGDESSDDTAGSTESGPRYRFKERPWDERREELQRLIENEPVDEMTREEVVEIVDLSYGGFFDKERGTLPKLEEKYGDQYPEFR